MSREWVSRLFEREDQTQSRLDIAKTESKLIASQIMKNPVTVVENTWNSLLHKFTSIIVYLGGISIAMLLTPNNSFGNLIDFAFFVSIPLAVVYVMLTFIPTIKMGSKTLFSRNNLSLENQIKMSYRITKAFVRRLYEIQPTFVIAGVSTLVILVIVVMS